MAVKGPDLSNTLAVLMMILLAIQTSHVASQPSSSCRRRCGSVDIPYPFGFGEDGEDCYLLPGFNLSCETNPERPVLIKPNYVAMPLVDITLSSGRMRLMMYMSWDCYNRSGPIGPSTWGLDLRNTPYSMSYTENVFTGIGCDTLAFIDIGNNNTGGCISGCNDMNNVVDGTCSGVGCCLATIPEGLKMYNTKFESRTNHSGILDFNNCSYSFLVERNNYTFRRPDLTFIDVDNLMLPLVVDWAIGNQSCEEAKRNASSYACVSSNSHCVNSSNGPGYICNCLQGYEGNPYLVGGCQDIDECKLDRGRYPCYGNCINTEGSYNCSCPEGYSSDDPKKEKCILWPDTSKSGLSLGLRLVIGLGSALIFLFIASSFYYLTIQKRKIASLREKFFQQNGGVVLQQIISSYNINSFKIFTILELEKATKKFANDQILGRGGFGVVYKGTLDDSRVIAVKKSMMIDDKRSKEFAKEMSILSQVNHKNIVKLLGCCLEVEIPMLVYEYIPNGTVFNYIHDKSIQIPFGNRLKIAIEVAEALRYLHTDASPPILHGDVKSSNILLDENYIAKVSDFGTSTLAPKDKSEFTTIVQGTYGYLDPEYLLTSQLTDKSDVYSFGVVLVELLTRKMPFFFEGPERERSLAFHFTSCMNEENVIEILDPDIVDEGMLKEAMKVANIAMQCLGMNREDRPTMKEVTMKLEALKGVPVYPWLPNTPSRGGLYTESSTISYDTSAAYDMQSGR